MNILNLPFARFAVFCLIGAALTTPSLRAQDATQDLTLVTGWNSVWLEVEPVYDTGTNAGLPKSPEDVFTNPAILTIVSPQPLAGLAEFFGSDPGTITTFNQAEWQQWKRSDPPGSNNLPAVTGNRAYLIQTNAPVSLPLTGRARFFRPTWTADRYNLVGFGLDGTPPTFAAFFGPSGAKHPVAKIFRLDPPSGNWQHVTGSTPMVSGQAYWVFSSGPSTYTGPVSVDFDQAATGKLNFGGPGDSVPVDTGVDALELDLKELVFTNLGASAVTPELDLIAPDPASGSLALHVVRPTSDSLAYERGNQVDSSAGPGGSADLEKTIAAQSTGSLTLGAQRLWSIGLAGRTNLYRLKTGAGCASFWLPVSAINNSLQAPTDLVPTGDSALAGLWVGEVVINAVTSIVVDGAPAQPSAGSAPIRVILHADAAGAVSLLSQVTIMQTVTADPEIVPTQVLVVDPAKIPFFEGIKERNGKRVGMRLEAVAYDMPRKLDAASQAALLADATYPELTEEGLADFLISRKSRPPTLAEKYHLSWAMTGAVGSGKTVQGTLALDPFHRSNPFRHAYHQQHSSGPNITRTMTLVFDADQSVSDRLRGSFTETLQGLIQSDLTLTGQVEFTRVSPVATLDAAP